MVLRECARLQPTNVLPDLMAAKICFEQLGEVSLFFGLFIYISTHCYFYEVFDFLFRLMKVWRLPNKL